MFSVTISDEPKIFGNTGEIKAKDQKKAIQFVKENKDLLLDIWKGKVSPDDAIFKKVA